MKTSQNKLNKYNKNIRQTTGFTIVELLISIVIIAILAAIITVSYRGITGKANEAAITADLTNASKKLAMYYVEYGTYPDDLDGSGCPTGPKTDANYCIKLGSGIAFNYDFKTTSTYDLTFAKGTLTYKVTESLPPASVNTTLITAVAAITGTPQTSQTLTAGTITPAGATVSYQWQSATTAGGTYTNIAGATSNTYAVSPATIGKYIKVTVTGTGTYSGTQTSTATSTAVAADTNWLTIGSQTWAKANLNVGTRIAGTTNQTNNATTEKYCYSDTDSNCTTYGGLYQWDEAMQYSTVEKAQGICPAGAHIPSDNDWKILEVQLGMTQTQADTQDAWRGTDQGTQLKSGGTSGLNVLPAGFRYTDGSFNLLSSYANLWSSSELGTSAWNRYLDASHVNVYRNTLTKANGFSVRCLGN